MQVRCARPPPGCNPGEQHDAATNWGCLDICESMLQVVIIVRGIESIRIAEKASAPVLIGLSAAVLIWAVRTAGGWGPMLSQVRSWKVRSGPS